MKDTAHAQILGDHTLVPCCPGFAENLIFEASLDPLSEMGRGISEALKAVFKQQGLSLEIREFPSRRGLQELKFGRVDGTMARIGNLSSLYAMKDVVRIDVPMYTLAAYVWCSRDPALMKSVKVGYRLGNVMATKMIHAVDADRVKTEAVSSYRSAVEMLKSGRLTCILSNPVLLEAEGIDPKTLDAFERKELLTVRTYAWMNKRYEKYKPLLEQGLRTYAFPKGFAEKYNSQKPVCQGEFEVLCPDGLVYTRVIDFRKAMDQPDPAVSAPHGADLEN